VDWTGVWASVAGELDEHRVAGLERLLTEDVVRFATVKALVSSGVAPERIRAEWRPQRGVTVDLVVDDPVTAAVEFKYPREPTETNAAWTQHLGELMKDYYRLAVLPEYVTTRWCVQLMSNRLRRYLDGVARNHGVRLGMIAGDVTTLTRGSIAAVPATARGSLTSWAAEDVVVSARCVDVLDVGAGLRLLTHLVQPAEPGPLT
jgi:hypothetical protein